MSTFADPAEGSLRRWVIFAVGAINFIISMFYRVSIAVIAPSLIDELKLDTSQLGDLSAAFFYGFAICQLPLGLAIDRLGPRVTTIFLGFAAVMGAIVFAAGSSYEHLVLGRLLLGIGMGGNLMVVLALLAVWFPPDRFASLSSTVVAIGVVGNLFAATPLAWMNDTIGWRACFMVFAIIDSIIITSFVFVMRNYPPGHARKTSRRPNLMDGVRQLARMFPYWVISFGNFVRYGYFVAIQGLWATPFLVYGLGFTDMAAANALLFLGIGYMVGLPFFGYLSDKVVRSRKKVILFTMTGAAILTGSVILWPDNPSTSIIFSTFFGIGMLTAPGQISYAHIKELVPPSISAQAMTAVNLFTILGAALITQFLGMIAGGEVSQFSGSADFKFMWIVGCVLLAIASILYCFVPDSPVFQRLSSEKSPERHL